MVNLSLNTGRVCEKNANEDGKKRTIEEGRFSKLIVKLSFNFYWLPLFNCSLLTTLFFQPDLS